MARIGLMLYSVRRACADDFQGTLRTIAAMGYAGVEVFDLHGHAVADVRGWLDDDGLDVCGLTRRSLPSRRIWRLWSRRHELSGRTGLSSAG